MKKEPHKEGPLLANIYLNELDKSADEVRALRDHKDQIGLQDDLMGDDDLKNELNNGAMLVIEGTATQKSQDSTKETYSFNKRGL